MDVTERAAAQGYTFGNGWTVEALTEPDLDGRPTDYDCYESPDIEAWNRDEWRFVCLVVRVLDDDGREWGRDVLGACEQGLLSSSDTPIDPLGDDDGYLPDLITNACLAAVTEAERFCVTWPAGKPSGAWVTGHNIAGYLPEADTHAVQTWQDARDAFVATVQEYSSDNDEAAYQLLSETADPADYPDYESNGYGDDEPAMRATVDAILQDDGPDTPAFRGKDFGMVVEDNDGRLISFWLQWSTDRTPGDDDA